MEQVEITASLLLLPYLCAYPPALIFLFSNVKMSFFKTFFFSPKIQMLKERLHFEIGAFDGAADDRWWRDN